MSRETKASKIIAMRSQEASPCFPLNSKPNWRSAGVALSTTGYVASLFSAYLVEGKLT